MDDPDDALLASLEAVLSRDELRRVLAGGLASLDEAGRQRLMKRLGPESGATLGTVLDARSRGDARKAPVPGRARICEQWDELWREWDECVFESGNEEGKYVHQDEHWEPPYLDVDGVSHDLDEIAAGLGPLIPRVVEENLDPKFTFAERLAETAADVGSGLPEWMDTDGGAGCSFGAEVTRCLLEWEWRTGRKTGLDSFAFVGRIRTLQRSLTDASLDEDAIAAFVAGLDDEQQRAVLAGLLRERTRSPWAEVLDSPHSGWFRLFQQLARRWDPTVFAQTSRAHIAGDWRLALPLLTPLLRRRAFREALALVAEAVRSLLPFGAGESWDPCADLLIRHHAVRYAIRQGDAEARLLDAWRRAAAGVGQSEVAGALEIQSVITRRREDWDAVLATFERAEKTAGRAICDRLFAAWQQEVAEGSVGVVDERSDGMEYGWLRALTDAARAGAEAAVFHRAVRAWLAAVERAPGAVERSRQSIETLTLDVDSTGWLKRSCPVFHRVLSQWRPESNALARSRRQWIQRLRGSELLGDVADFWKRNAAALLPDPAEARNSHYEHHAEWAAAIHELDAETGAGILRRWAVAHQRRRNLWQALARCGLHAGGA